MSPWEILYFLTRPTNFGMLMTADIRFWTQCSTASDRLIIRMQSVQNAAAESADLGPLGIVSYRHPLGNYQVVQILTDFQNLSPHGILSSKFAIRRCDDSSPFATVEPTMLFFHSLDGVHRLLFCRWAANIVSSVKVTQTIVVTNDLRCSVQILGHLFWDLAFGCQNYSNFLVMMTNSPCKIW